MRVKTLIQLDGDKHASSFDAIVALDAGVEQLLQYENVQPDDVASLVHGAMFTRGGSDLNHTAIFIGGTEVTHGEALLRTVLGTFFGDMRVSVMLDSAGCNTSAAAAVLLAGRHVDLPEATALVLAATGSVGRRTARLLLHAGARVRIASRSAQRAASVIHALVEQHGAHVRPRLSAVAITSDHDLRDAAQDTQVVIAAGAAGVELTTLESLHECPEVRLVIDLNAVPPAGIRGVQPADFGEMREQRICYGALGVGSLKMKLHKAAIQRLFKSHRLVLDAEGIHSLGLELDSHRPPTLG